MSRSRFAARSRPGHEPAIIISFQVRRPCALRQHATAETKKTTIICFGAADSDHNPHFGIMRISGLSFRGCSALVRVVRSVEGTSGNGNYDSVDGGSSKFISCVLQSNVAVNRMHFRSNRRQPSSFNYHSRLATGCRPTPPTSAHAPTWSRDWPSAADRKRRVTVTSDCRDCELYVLSPSLALTSGWFVLLVFNDTFSINRLYRAV